MKKFTWSFLAGMISLLLYTTVISAADTDAPEFELEWGENGSGAGGNVFDFTSGITTSEFGGNTYIYVIDLFNEYIKKYNTDGSHIESIPASGPNYVAADDEGNIFTTEFPFRVKKYDSNGDLVTQWGTEGTGNGEFGDVNPYGLDYNVITDEIVVADAGNNRVQRFTNTGTYVGQFGVTGDENGEFSNPTDIAVDSIGNIYVADSFNNRVQIFSSSGVYIDQFGSAGSGNGQFDGITGITIDKTNEYVYVVEYYRVQKFSLDGTYLAQWGSSGTDEGEFDVAWDVAVAGDSVFVTDQENHRVQKFTYQDEPTPTPSPSPTTTPESNVSSGTFTTPRPSGCSDSLPDDAPILFQINRLPTSLDLYFTPVKNATGYVIRYGLENTVEQFGTSFNWQENTGVIKYTINELDPKTAYTFQVRAQRGCATGNWSNTQKVTAPRTNGILKFFLFK